MCWWLSALPANVRLERFFPHAHLLPHVSRPGLSAEPGGVGYLADARAVEGVPWGKGRGPSWPAWEQRPGRLVCAKPSPPCARASGRGTLRPGWGLKKLLRI